MHLLSSDGMTLLGFDDDSGAGFSSRISSTSAGAGMVLLSSYFEGATGPAMFFENYSSPCSDTDQDGIQDILEQMQPGGIVGEKDSDRDGLLDGWEWDGVNNVSLSSLGLNLGRRDVLVENDYMWTTTHNHSLTDEIVSRAQALYSQIAISNPDGTTGIRLTVLRDSPILDDQYADICSPGTRHISDYAASRNPDLVGIAHWVVGVHSSGRTGAQGDNNGDRLSYGNDRGVFLDGGQYESSDGLIVYSQFIHELGHNFGLDHGGGDGVNCKPNYPSLMNYAYDYNAFNPRLGKCSGYSFSESDSLQYSRGTNSSLDESSLVEIGGIGPTPTTARFLECFDSDWLGANFFHFDRTTGCVDWNRNGGCESTSYSMLIRSSGSCGTASGQSLVLTDFDDHRRIAEGLSGSIRAPVHCGGGGGVTTSILLESDPGGASAEVRQMAGYSPSVRNEPNVCGAPHER